MPRPSLQGECFFGSRLKAPKGFLDELLIFRLDPTSLPIPVHPVGDPYRKRRCEREGYPTSQRLGGAGQVA